jgi:hypothetical protein
VLTELVLAAVSARPLHHRRSRRRAAELVPSGRIVRSRGVLVVARVIHDSCGSFLALVVVLMRVPESGCAIAGNFCLCRVKAGRVSTKMHRSSAVERVKCSSRRPR